MWNKIILIIAVISMVGTAGTIAYKFVSSLQEENRLLTSDNATLAANVIKLGEAIQTQQDTIDSINADIALKDTVLTNVLSEFSIERNRVVALETRLREHDIGYLAANKPGLVEPILNNATANINRCFEIASGSPLTQTEINATLPSEINTECSFLANPNYKEQ